MTDEPNPDSLSRDGEEPPEGEAARVLAMLEAFAGASEAPAASANPSPAPPPPPAAQPPAEAVAASPAASPSQAVAEKELLAAVAQSSAAFEAAQAQGLKPFMFSPPLDILAREAFSLREESGGLDAYVLEERLRTAGKLEAAGGGEAVAELFAMAAPAPDVAGERARIIITARRKEALAVAHAKAAEDIKSGLDPEAVRRELDRVRDAFAAGCGVRIGVATPRSNRDLLEAIITKEGVAGLSTGYEKLDFLLNGLEAGRLYLIGARPGEGKSALLLDIATNVCLNGHRAALFTYEMAEKELFARQIFAQAGISKAEARTESFRRDRKKLDSLLSVSDKCAALPFSIVTPAKRTVEEFAAAARSIKKKWPALALIAVDYLQLIKSEKKDRTREQEVADVARTLKALSQELSVAMLSAAQVNRDCTKGGNRSPQLSELRESGALEQDADAVILLHRMTEEEAEGGAEKRGKAARAATEEGEEEERTHAVLDVAKNRDGMQGKAHLTFSPSTAHFIEPWRSGRGGR